MSSIGIFLYGVAVGKCELFPYSQIENAYGLYKTATLTKVELEKLESELEKLESKKKRAQAKLEKQTLTEKRRSEKRKILKPKKEEIRKIWSSYSKAADVVFVGDSITARGYWHDFFPNVNVANRGVGGDTTRDVLNRLDSIISTRPKSVFIMLGINDFFIRKHDITLGETINNYEAIIDSLLVEGISVYIQSTISCYRLFCGEERVGAINELNRALRQIADKKRVTFIDLRNLSLGEGLSSEYTTDGVHLTFEGYRYWVETIKPLVVSN